MAVKRQAAQKKINLLNSKVFAKAMAVFKQTGNYPNINIPTANTIGAQALQFALTKRGDPYVWGAAGPSSFDCSGLVAVGLRPGRHQPAALHRRPVEHGRARGPGRPAARVTWCSSSPTSVTSASTSATA